MNIALTVQECDKLLDLIEGNRTWSSRIFGKQRIAKYNIAVFFLQLIAAKITFFGWAGNEVKIVVTRDDEGNYRYENEVNWEGFFSITKGIIPNTLLKSFCK